MHQRQLAGASLGIVEEAAGAFVGIAIPFAAFLGCVPNLHLRDASQVDSRVCFGNGLVFQPQLEVGVVLHRRQVLSRAIVDQLAVFDAPMFMNVLNRCLVELFALFGRKCQPLGWILGRSASPTGQVLSVEERHEALRRSVDRRLLGASDDRQDEEVCDEQENAGGRHEDDPGERDVADAHYTAP